MHGRAGAGIEDASPDHFGIEQPVVATFHPLPHRGLQPGEGLRQDRLPPRALLQVEAGETIGAGGKGLEELLHWS